MQINKIQNSPSFSASLKIEPLSYYGIKMHDYKTEMPLSEFQERLLKQKFEKATKDIKGLLTIDLGRRNIFNIYENRTSGLLYNNEKHSDSIPVYFKNISSDNEFVDKLVKMLDIFKMREKNFKKINDLKSQAAKLSQSTRASSLGATETLFEMPNWRNNSTIK